jgi:LysM repeat protein
MHLFPAKPSKPAPSAARRKLHAAVARRAARAPSIEEEEEPTTSFKTALIVVVLLHLIAAGGVYMFDSIKTHRPTAGAADVSKKTAVALPSAAAPTAAAAQRAKPQPVAAAATPAAPASAEVKDSGELYIVAKGDKPVAIAKKLRVAYDDLLKLNKIDDPTKLRIGQKLHVPIKPRASAN